MKKTEWTIEECKRGWFGVRDNCMECICIDKESVLHAIWVIEGKVIDNFYVADRSGVVTCVDRGSL